MVDHVAYGEHAQYNENKMGPKQRPLRHPTKPVKNNQCFTGAHHVRTTQAEHMINQKYKSSVYVFVIHVCAVKVQNF